MCLLTTLAGASSLRSRACVVDNCCHSGGGCSCTGSAVSPGRCVCAVFGCGIVLGVFGGVSIVHFVVFISILLC